MNKHIYTGINKNKINENIDNRIIDYINNNTNNDINIIKEIVIVSPIINDHKNCYSYHHSNR